MLTTHDIGNLFQSMRTAYGGLWKHGNDAMGVWREALKGFTPRQLQLATNDAVKHHVDFPPNLPQFVQIISESVPQLPGPAQENLVLTERVHAYTKAETKTNPGGNPHKINLPESIADRQMGESAVRYEKRISDEITFALYPSMRRKFQR